MSKHPAVSKEPTIRKEPATIRNERPKGSKQPAPPGKQPATAGKPPAAIAELGAAGLWFYNWNIWLEARRLLDRALAPLGLKPREYWLLALAGPGDVSQHELAGLCGLDPSSLVAVLDGLESRGWLRRTRNPRDRRMQWVQRTPAGDQLFTRALPRAQRAEARQMAALSPAQQRQLLAAMRKLAASSK